MSKLKISIYNKTKELTYNIEPENSLCPLQIYADGLEGFDVPNFNIYSESSAVYNKSEIIGRNIPDRELTIKMRTKAGFDIGDVLEDFAIMFNPEDDYRITVYAITTETERYIDGVLSGILCPVSNLEKHIDITIGFWCAYPYWKEDYLNEYSFTASSSYMSVTIPSSDLGNLEHTTPYAISFYNGTGSTITLNKFEISNRQNAAYISSTTSMGLSWPYANSLVFDFINKEIRIGSTSLINYVNANYLSALEKFFLTNDYRDAIVRVWINSSYTEAEGTLYYHKEHLSCF